MFFKAPVKVSSALLFSGSLERNIGGRKCDEKTSEFITLYDAVQSIKIRPQDQ